MKTIYIDSEFKCHTVNDGTMTAIETDAFDGKCDAYIEMTRFVPRGMEWTRADGEVFLGQMVTPWVDSRERDSAQRAYEREKLADAENALKILLGGNNE